MHNTISNLKLLCWGICFLVSISTGSLALAETKNTLLLAASDSATDVLEAYHQFLRLSYREIGYEVQIKKVPVKRTYKQADIEKVDGLLIATEAVLKMYDNLMTVPVALNHVHLSVFSITRQFEVSGPETLRDYRTGILRGYMISDKITEGMDRQVVNTYDSLLSVLKAGRVDVVIGLEREIKRFVAAHPEYGTVKALAPPLHSFPMYHFLNKRHADLIPRVSPVMERLVKEKVLEELYAPYEIK